MLLSISLLIWLVVNTYKPCGYNSIVRNGDKMIETKKASILYRGNTSLDGLVPIIEGGLIQEGFSKVFVKRFEQGTGEESIAKYVKDHADDILESSVLTDETCHVHLYSIGVRWKQVPYFRGAYYILDGIANNVAIETVKAEIGQVDGYGYEDRNLDPKTTLEKTKAIYRGVLKSVNQRPINVYILNPNLTDHVPFRKTGKDIQPSNLLKSWFEDAFDDSVPVTVIGEDFTHWGNIDSDEDAALILSSFAGIPKGSWYVSDRHVPEHLRPVEISGVVCLQVPLDNFLRGLIENGLYNVESRFQETYKDKVLEHTQRVAEISK